MRLNSTSLDQCRCICGPSPLQFAPMVTSFDAAPTILAWGDNVGAAVLPCLPTLSTHAVCSILLPVLCLTTCKWMIIGKARSLGGDYSQGLL